MHKFGIVGMGVIGSIYADVIESLPDTKLVFISDLDEKQATRENYIHPSDIFHTSIDTLIVATTNASHFYYSMAAINNGFNVICEKPIVTSLEDINALRAVKNGKILFPAYHCRYRTEVAFALAELKGRVCNFDHYYQENFAEASRWYYDVALSGGGALLDIGVNQLDWLSKLVVDIEPLETFINEEHQMIDISSTVAWKHSKGCGKTVFGWNHPNEKKYTEILCTSGDIYLLDHLNHCVYKSGKLVVEGRSDEYSAVVRDFLNLQYAGMACDLNESYATLNTIKKCYKLAGWDLLD